MFQRYVFGDGKWLVVLGYSVTYFEEPLKPADLASMVHSAFSRKLRPLLIVQYTQEHTWYEDYRLAFADRRRIEERHDPAGRPAKQTFYIVRFCLRCNAPPSHTDPAPSCRIRRYGTRALRRRPRHRVSRVARAQAFLLAQDVLSANTAVFSFLQADSWDESRTSAILPHLSRPVAHLFRRNNRLLNELVSWISHPGRACAHPAVLGRRLAGT